MSHVHKKDRQGEVSLIKRLELIAVQQTVPFDAYKLAKLTGQTPMAVGRALSTLARNGALKALGEAQEGSLAERYIWA